MACLARNANSSGRKVSPSFRNAASISSVCSTYESCDSLSIFTSLCSCKVVQKNIKVGKWSKPTAVAFAASLTAVGTHKIVHPKTSVDHVTGSGISFGAQESSHDVLAPQIKLGPTFWDSQQKQLSETLLLQMACNHSLNRKQSKHCIETCDSLSRNCPGCFFANILITSGVLKASLIAAWIACTDRIITLINSKPMVIWY